ncbi:hypothetical protein CERZMDRAFT_96371 [Cercospora zeae-maydis SCOH1-5]|uniref:Uncharacterized protein n=1 Tax=Cercospora zeae-maydis SCOH1-5 TaxID=717836 RepID=A0A6A6FJD0_9PEZI|nr:hypothetical protein CERZMDRAFT_96371 [Cercospora zeae-maydis SCOH1-5]
MATDDLCPRAKGDDITGQYAVQTWMTTKYDKNDLLHPGPNEAKLWSAVQGMTDVLGHTGPPLAGIAYADMAAVVAIILMRMEKYRMGIQEFYFGWSREAVRANLHLARAMVPAHYWHDPDECQAVLKYQEPGTEWQMKIADAMFDWDSRRIVRTPTSKDHEDLLATQWFEKDTYARVGKQMAARHQEALDFDRHDVPTEDFVPLSSATLTAPAQVQLQMQAHVRELYMSAIRTTAAAYRTANSAAQKYLLDLDAARKTEAAQLAIVANADSMARDMGVALGRFQAMGYESRSQEPYVEHLTEHAAGRLMTHPTATTWPKGLADLLARTRYHNTGPLVPLFDVSRTHGTRVALSVPFAGPESGVWRPLSGDMQPFAMPKLADHIHWRLHLPEARPEPSNPRLTARGPQAPVEMHIPDDPRFAPKEPPVSLAAPPPKTPDQLMADKRAEAERTANFRARADRMQHEKEQKAAEAAAMEKDRIDQHTREQEDSAAAAASREEEASEFEKAKARVAAAMKRKKDRDRRTKATGEVYPVRPKDNDKADDLTVENKMDRNKAKTDDLTMEDKTDTAETDDLPVEEGTDRNKTEADDLAVENQKGKSKAKADGSAGMSQHDRARARLGELRKRQREAEAGKPGSTSDKPIEIESEPIVIDSDGDSSSSMEELEDDPIAAGQDQQLAIQMPNQMMAPGGQNQMMAPGGQNQMMTPGGQNQMMTPGGQNQMLPPAPFYNPGYYSVGGFNGYGFGHGAFAQQPFNAPGQYHQAGLPPFPESFQPLPGLPTSSPLSSERSGPPSKKPPKKKIKSNHTASTQSPAAAGNQDEDATTQPAPPRSRPRRRSRATTRLHPAPAAAGNQDEDATTTAGSSKEPPKKKIKSKHTASTQSPAAAGKQDEDATTTGSDFATDNLWYPGLAFDQKAALQDPVGYSSRKRGEERAAKLPLYCAMGRISPACLPPKGVRLDDYTVGALLELKDHGGFGRDDLGQQWPAVFDSKGYVRSWRQPAGRPYVIQGDSHGWYALVHNTRLLRGEGPNIPFEFQGNKREAIPGKWIQASDTEVQTPIRRWATIIDPLTLSISMRNSLAKAEVDPDYAPAFKHFLDTTRASDGLDETERATLSTQPTDWAKPDWATSANILYPHALALSTVAIVNRYRKLAPEQRSDVNKCVPGKAQG